MKMKSPSSNLFEFSSHEPTFGCVSAILRHFRCQHKISTEENYTEVDLSTRELKPQSPNIVARLMGLDSMPTSPNSGDLNSLSRSRSQTSISTCAGILTERTNSSPIQSSVPLYEKPIYLREENDDFLILSFTPDEDLSNWDTCSTNTRIDRGKIRTRRKRSSEKCVGDSHEKRENCIKLERFKENCKNNGELPLILDLEKIKLNQRKVETESLSQNSSPVSVLGLPETQDECSTEPNSPNSEETRASPQADQPSSRKKLSSNFENIEGSSSPSNSHANEKSHKFANCGIALLDQTFLKQFVEEDFKNSVWVEREIKKPVHGEEISIEIGLEMLDELLLETTSVICSNFN